MCVGGEGGIDGLSLCMGTLVCACVCVHTRDRWLVQKGPFTPRCLLISLND